MKLIDNIYNLFLFIKNNIFKYLFNIKYGFFNINLDKYNLIKYDDFTKHDIGFWTPLSYNENEQIIDPSLVKFTNSGLLLQQKGQKIGQIQTREPLNFGVYDINLEFPIGSNLNPKINLISNNTNPPKITILEGISDCYSKYRHRIYNNLFYGIYGLNSNEIGNRKTLMFKENDLCTLPVNLKFLFSDKKIEIYLNNYKVRSITDKKILYYFKNHNFKLVLTNGILHNSENECSTFRIKSFAYYN